MRIFVLLSRVPWPLEKGDKLRAFNQIKVLSENNEIFLCALNTNKADKQAAFRALHPYCKSIVFIDISKTTIFLNLIKALFSGIPFQCGYFYSRRAQKRINKELKRSKPDIIFAQLARVAEYVRHSKLPKAIDYQDTFSMGIKRRLDIAPWYKKPFMRAEYRRLIRYEHRIFDEFDLKTIISDTDRRLIPHDKRDEILIVPNGVDHDFFNISNTVEKKYDLVFCGNMSYAPNVNAVEYLAYEILPLVWKTLPDAKMYIAGANPDPKVKKAASERVIISGWLDDIRDAYAQSRVFIAPMRIGTGLQNKLLEAMSMRLPSITSPLANSSLGAESDKEILVGANAEELAQHIITLLTDQKKAEQIAQAGYDFTNRVYDWGKATEILENEMKKYGTN